MSREDSLREDIYFNNLLLHFSKTLERNSKDLYSKRGSLSSQVQLIDREKEPEEFKKIESKFKHIQKVTAQISTLVSEFSQDELKKYMISCHEIGELQSSTQLIAEKDVVK